MGAELRGWKSLDHMPVRGVMRLHLELTGQPTGMKEQRGNARNMQFIFFFLNYNQVHRFNACLFLAQMESKILVFLIKRRRYKKLTSAGFKQVIVSIMDNVLKVVC